MGLNKYGHLNGRTAKVAATGPCRTRSDYDTLLECNVLLRKLPPPGQRIYDRLT
jgi:hypothetical protein